jgi:hypothetical protein
VVALLAVSGTATAFSVASDGVPSEAAVEEDVTVTYTIDDPFTDAPDQWTLRGSTELESVSWQVTVFRAGTQISEETYGSQNISQDLDIDDNGDEVEIELSGTVPAVENYTYAPEESFTVATLARQTGNNTEEFQNDSAHHYTEESREAREAIDAAQASIDEAGGNEEAEQLVDSAVSSYENGNFQNAVDLATQAQETAESAQQSQQTTRTLLIAAGVIIVLLLLGGGAYYLYSQQGDDYSKL